MENSYIIPTSSIKLDVTAKGLIVPTVHVYVGATDEQLDTIRRQSMDQLKKIIIDINEAKLSSVIAIVGES